MEPNKKDKIEQIVNCFETGSKEGDYSDVTLFRDGPNRRLQVTYGKAGVTEYGGNLKLLLNHYIEKKGAQADAIQPYISKIGKIPSVIAVDKEFVALLKTAGHDPIMREAQDEIFDSAYWKPAFKFFTDLGFTTNLAMLVIYDSFIHSGSIPSWLRNRFSESPPSRGGDEKKWIKSYVETRHQWLKFHSNPLLRNTIYRTNTFKAAIAQDDWILDDVVNANGVRVA